MTKTRQWYRIFLLVQMTLIMSEVVIAREERHERERAEQPTPHVCQSCDRPLL